MTVKDYRASEMRDNPIPNSSARETVEDVALRRQAQHVPAVPEGVEQQRPGGEAFMLARLPDCPSKVAND